MYKSTILRLLSIALCVFSLQAIAKDDRFFVGFDAGKSHYTHIETETKDSNSVVFFNVGQTFDNNVFVTATVAQYEQVYITNEKTNLRTGYKVSGLQFSIGKELPIYGPVTTSADVDLMHWMEKRDITDLSVSNSASTVEDKKAYSLGVGFNINVNLSDKTKVSLRTQGFTTENFGFRNTLLSMKFEI